MIDNLLVTQSRIESMRNEILKSAIINDSAVKVTLVDYHVGRFSDNINFDLSLKIGEHTHTYHRGFSVYEHDYTNDAYIYIRQVLERDIERLEELRVHKLKYNRGGIYHE